MAALLLLPAAAQAGEIPVLKRNGAVAERHDPGVASLAPRSERMAYRQERHGHDRRVTPRRQPAARAAAKRRTVPGELKRMLAAGAIDEPTYRDRRRAYYDAKKLVRRLEGRRKVEMGAVVGLLDDIAARRALTVSRVAPLWLTLERNRRWWTTGPLPASGQRVSFEGSEVVWQYFPGEGLAIHPLANFGKLNALWRTKVDDDRLELLLDELLALPAERGGALAWEYYFDFGGGRPPWVSGLAQGTGLQSIARAAIRLGRKDEIWPVTKRALRLFHLPPPVGVRVDAGGGAHYLIYSFNPNLRVLNGFAQALVGLYDYGAYANDDEARRLFADGDVAAKAEVPQYDTSAWSLYSRGSVTRESDLGYHELVTGFLKNLCRRTAEAVYCDTATRFQEYLLQEPEVALVTQRLRGGKTGSLRFDLSKISRVGVRVARGDKVVMSRVDLLGYGRRSVAWTVPRKAGDYDVRLTAVDLAGNTSEAFGSVEVLKPKPVRKKRRRP